MARYTSAAPVFFTELENYVDGGVLANNPCNQGLAKIQNFQHDQHKKLPISLVVSIGTGIYPVKKMGSINVQDFTALGVHWFSFKDSVFTRTQNLMELLSTAVST